MAKPYFREVPNFEYVSRNPGNKYISEFNTVKNLFKRGKLREDIFGNLAFFEKYSIIGDERPDNVAYKFYNEETLDWVILLSNNILNIQTEWPMPQSVFDKVMLDRYGSYDNLYNGIHHYETEEVKNSLGITVIKGGMRISPTWKTNGNFIEAFNDKVYDFYSGDGITSSEIGTLRLFNPIVSLEIGSSITIENMPDSQYNGTFVITEILNPTITDDGVVLSSSFLIKFPTAPTNPNPLGIDQIRVYENITERFILKKPEFRSTENNIEGVVNPPIAHYYQYFDSNLGSYNLIPSTSFIRPVTNYEYESQLQDEKRNIYILKPEYLNIVFDDLTDIMSYKRGSQQYISENLKKGDNVRLYE